MILGWQRIAPAAAAGERLDRWLLVQHPTSTRRAVQAALRAGEVRSDGRPAEKGVRLRGGETILVRSLREAADMRTLPNPDAPLCVVHADAHVLLFNKPPGQPVQPLDPDECWTLANAMVARYPETATLGADPLLPALVHRIDRGTSGLVLAARTADAYADLRAQFARRTVGKDYLAVVHGALRRGARLQNDLIHDSRDRGRMRICADQSPLPRGERRLAAETFIQPVARAGDYTLVAARITTGVTHQIRCQLAHAGFPIVGDPRYGDAPSGAPLDVAAVTVAGQLLHAARLEFRHPATGGRAVFLAEWPPDRRNWLRSVGLPDEAAVVEGVHGATG